MSNVHMNKLYLASLNKAKIEATKQVFSDFDVIPVKVEISSKQPLSEVETINCAKERLKKVKDGYRLGLEAGTTIINDKCFLVNYGVLIDKDDKVYIAGGSYLELPEKIREELYNNHLELKDAMHKHYGDVLTEQGGTIEFFTNGLVKRVDIFTHIGKILKGELERKEKHNA